MTKRTKIKAWTHIDIITKKILRYDRRGMDFYQIHFTRAKAINFHRANSIPLRNCGCRVVPCTITF